MIEIEKKNIPAYLPLIAYLMYDFHRDLLEQGNSAYNVWREIGFWRDLMEINITLDGLGLGIGINQHSDGIYQFRINNQIHRAYLKTMELNEIELVIDNHSHKFVISNDSKGNGFVGIDSHIFSIRRNDILVSEDIFGTLDHGGKAHGEIVSPMPGKVVKINVKEGQPVKKGDLLLVVEAMKMENNIVSPKEGTIKKINVKTGEMVNGSRELVVLAEN